MISGLETEQLKEIEKGQMNKLEAKGLIRRVTHIRYDEPKTMKRKHGKDLTIIGETLVNLYKKEELLKHKTDKGYDYDKVTPIAYAETACSASENSYNKRIGRIIATGRALKRL